MALFGRESEAHMQRIERFKTWLDSRSKPALLSLCAGAFSVIEFWTMVLGLLAGIAAIALGIAGHRELHRSTTLDGRRLATGGIALGLLGIALSLTMYFWGYGYLKSLQG